MNVQNLWLAAAPGIGPHAVISEGHPDGLAASLFSTREQAEQVGAPFEPLLLPSLWDARVLAGEGYAGLLLDGSTPIYWASTDPAAALPTHLLMPYGQGEVVIDAQGVSALAAQEVTRWQNLPRVDARTNAILLGDLPFYSYRPDMPLYEYLPDRENLTLAPTGGALLQGADDAHESVAFFTTPFATEWYWEAIGLPLTGDADTAREITRHDDIVARLNALADLPADVAIILNPGRHRFYQGFFRFIEQQWYLITINGLWHVAAPFGLTQLAKRSPA